MFCLYSFRVGIDCWMLLFFGCCLLLVVSWLSVFVCCVLFRCVVCCVVALCVVCCVLCVVCC